jgi:hypothetical protein
MAERFLPRTVKVADLRIGHEPKRKPSVISIAEASIRIKSKLSMQPSLRLNMATPLTSGATPQTRGAISIREETPTLQQKPTKKKEEIPLGENIQLTIAVTSPIILKEEAFRIEKVLKPATAPAKLRVKPQTKPLKLEREIALPKQEIFLKIDSITLPENIDKIVEFVTIRAQKPEETPMVSETKEPSGDLLDELFVPIGEYGGFDWDFGRLVCIITRSYDEDGKSYIMK